MELDGEQFYHRRGFTRTSCGPLCRPEVEQAVRHYIEEELHSVLFLQWEVKPGIDHPENDRVVTEFVDILAAMGIVES